MTFRWTPLGQKHFHGQIHSFLTLSRIGIIFMQDDPKTSQDAASSSYAVPVAAGARGSTPRANKEHK